MIDLKKIASGSDPKKTLKVMLSLAATFLVLWVFVLAQNGGVNSSDAASQGLVQVDSLNISLKPKTTMIPKQNAGNLVAHTFPVLLILGVVVAGLWFWQKKSPDKKENDLFTVVDRQQLGVGQQIIVILINNEYWVLGSAGKDISLMHRYSREEWQSGEPVKQKAETSRFLKIFTENQKKIVNGSES